MSFQLISNIQSGESVSRSVAVSAELPETIEKLLNGHSERIHSCIQKSDGVHFCYHIVDKWHVLSAVLRDSGSQIRMHHMALTEEEVAALQKNTSRPTPAGVIQALLSFGFWKTQGEIPTAPLTEPRMSASHLPDASTQHYWKHLTGHKGNAMVLLTPPYLGKSLICTPQHITQVDILHMLHESMWLTASRGWGKTFRTFFSGRASDFDAVDIATTYLNSRQVNDYRLSQHHVPILTLTSDMNVKEQEADTRSSLVPAMAPHPAPPTTQQTAIAQPTSPAEPYKYVEAPDYETFDIKPPSNKQVRSLQYIGGLLVLTTLVYVIVSNYVDFAAEPIDTEELTTHAEQKSIHMFVDTIRSGKYSEEGFRRIKATLQTDEHPRHAILAESIGRLTQSVHRAEGHADNLLYLLTQASVLELTPDELWAYYLRLATRDYPTAEWITHNTTPAAIQGWKNIFKKYPQLKQSAQNNKELKPYIAPIIQKISL